MKNYYYIFFISLFLTYSSCSKHQVESEYNDGLFRLMFDLKIDRPITLHVFYVNKYEDALNENQKITKKIDRSTLFKKIEIVFPKNVFPKKIRLDFGRTPTENEFTIKNFIIDYANKKVLLENEEFNLFFTPDNLHKTANKYKFKTKSTDKPYNPFLLSTIYLSQRLKIEY